MTWVRLDDNMTEHPKVAGLSNAAFRLHIHGISYCARNLTDGFIPKTVSRRLLDGNSTRIRQELVQSGVWESTETGYQIHDYHDYQPSRERVEQTRIARAKAGSKGGRRSEAKAEQNAKQDASLRLEAKSNPGPSRTQQQEKTLAATPRERDEIWEGFIKLCGPEPTTKSGRGSWNRAAKELRDAGDATPVEMERRAAAYHRRFSTTLTPTALAKYWGQLAVRRSSRPVEAQEPLPDVDPETAAKAKQRVAALASGIGHRVDL
jgi:hypothetical protein